MKHYVLIALVYNQFGGLSKYRFKCMDDTDILEIPIKEIRDTLIDESYGVKEPEILYHGLKLNESCTIEISNEAKCNKVKNGERPSKPRFVIVPIQSKDIMLAISLSGNLDLINKSQLAKLVDDDLVVNCGRNINGNIEFTTDTYIAQSNIIQLLNSAAEAEEEHVVDAIKEYNAKEDQKRKDAILKASREEKINHLDGHIDAVLENGRKLISKTIQSRPTKIEGKEVPSDILKKVDSTGMTVEQKITNLIFRLRECRPFYYSVLYCMDRIITYDVERAAITIGTLYLNPDYILKTPLESLLFVLCHEMAHVVLRHPERENNRVHDTWVVACDLYINKMLMQEFDLEFSPKEPKRVCYGDRVLPFSVIKPGNIKYSSVIDVNKDTPELIYKELMESLNDPEDLDNQFSNTGSSGSDGSGSSSGSNSSSSSNNSEDSNSSSGSNNSEDSNDKSDNGHTDSENNSDKSSDSQKSRRGSNSNKTNRASNNSQSDLDDSAEQQDGSNQPNKRKEKVIFRGIEIDLSDVADDIVENDESSKMSDSIRKAKLDSILNRAQTVYKNAVSKMAGGETNYIIERIVKETMAPKTNLKTLVTSFLTKSNDKYYTYIRPDRRFLSRGKTLPGPKKVEDALLKGVKIAIDTSGSISAEELGIAFGQLRDLFKKYKADAEVLYWDTQVRATYDFKELRDLIKAKPVGGGGTNVDCVFEHFEGMEYKKGLKERPSLIIIFSDGCFARPAEKYKKYGRQVIWVINDKLYERFDPPFGRKAIIKRK